MPPTARPPITPHRIDLADLAVGIPFAHMRHAVALQMRMPGCGNGGLLGLVDVAAGLHAARQKGMGAIRRDVTAPTVVVAEADWLTSRHGALRFLLEPPHG